MKAKTSPRPASVAIGVLIAAFLIGILSFGIHYLFHNRKMNSHAPATLTVLVSASDNAFLENIHEGDRVIDRTNRRILGTVTTIRIADSYEELYDAATGGVKRHVRDGLSDLTLTVSIDHTDHGYFVNPKEWKIGSSVTFATPNFAGVGTVIALTR